MEELAASLVAGAIAIPCFIFFLKIRDKIQAKKSQKERLYYCRQRLHNMTLQFRGECLAETKKVIARYTAAIDRESYHRDWSLDFISDYRKSINNLKNEYLRNYAMKYSGGDNRLRIEAEDLPAHVLEEYEAEISEIANTFRDLSYNMYEQIKELREKL